MSDTNRLEFLRQAGKSAWQGLKTVVKGVEIVVDPNDPANTASPVDAGLEAPGVAASSDPGSGGAAAAAEATGEAAGAPGGAATKLTVPRASETGKIAMRSGRHRMASAALTTEGNAVSEATLLQSLPVTLALAPSAANALIEQHLGLTGDRLPISCDLDTEVSGYRLAWLPIQDGVRTYQRVAGGRLAAVGGYRRAALVQFGAAPAGSPVWCNLGDDALFSGLPEAVRSSLLLEEPSRLLPAIRSGKAQVALLGGTELDWAERQPTAQILLELPADPDLGFLPAWGLFAAGYSPTVAPLDNGHVRLVPVSADHWERWGEEGRA